MQALLDRLGRIENLILKVWPDLDVLKARPEPEALATAAEAPGATPEAKAPAQKKPRTPPSPTEHGPGRRRPRSPRPTNLSPQDVYNLAYGDYNKGNYDLAIDGFKMYREHFPASPLADNALYMIGECYFSQKKYEDGHRRVRRPHPDLSAERQARRRLPEEGHRLDRAEKERGGRSRSCKLLIAKYPARRRGPDRPGKAQGAPGDRKMRDVNSLNKVILVGRLGHKPELRVLPQNGAGRGHFTLATNERFFNKNTQETVNRTEWHRIVVWGPLAEFCEKYLDPGQADPRRGQAPDPAAGRTRTGTSGPRPRSRPRTSSSSAGARKRAAKSAVRRGPPPPRISRWKATKRPKGGGSGGDDDIPF